MHNLATFQKSPLSRSTNGILGGVCQGLADAYTLDVFVLRSLFVISTILGLSLIVYPILWIVIPRVDQVYDYQSEKILGVCLRISRKLEVDLSVVRLLAVLIGILSFGSAILAYFAIFLYLELKSESKFF